MRDRTVTAQRFDVLARGCRTLFFFPTDIAIANGDSCYNRRHHAGRFRGQRIPFGAYVDFMPQNDTKVESMGAKTIPGVFIGYHIHAGGLWSGDYLVADYSPFRRDCDVAKSKVKIHRIREVVWNHSGRFHYQSQSYDENVSSKTRISTHLKMNPHGLGDASDDEDERPHTGAAGSSSQEGFPHSPINQHLHP